MMHRKFTYIANWKMYWDFDETVGFVTQYYDQLIALAQMPDTHIILCPSATGVYPLVQMFKDSNIVIGAQNCSSYNKGAFTGQISATNLKTVGCKYCIVGHSERRRYNHEDDKVVAEKFVHLLETGMHPILCIGETEKENKQGKTLAVLEEQLSPVLEKLATKNHTLKNFQLFLAYEPVWSIGTDQIPTRDHLETTFAWLSTFLLKKAPLPSWDLIYGGSISSNNINQLKSIKDVGGFLIGGSSLEFQELEKIIKYNIKE